MADAEESPSSLAELEALSGLEGTPGPNADDVGAEPDDFDLAGLAASTSTSNSKAPANVEAESGEDKVDLSALAASAVTESAGASSSLATHRDVAQASAGVAAVSASAAQASVSQASSVHVTRGPAGFVYGLLAGVAVAGVMFFVMRGGDSVARTDVAHTPAARQADGPATTSADARSNAVAPASATLPAPVASAPSSPTPGTAPAAEPAAPTPTLSAGASTPASTSQRPTRAPTGNPSATAPVASATAAAAVGSERDTNDDPTRPPAPAAAVEAPAAAPSRPIDSLLDDALGGKRNTKQASDNLMGPELPATPAAADVTQAIQQLLPAIRGCAMGQSGIANTLLVVRNDGAVASASITGAPYAGAASGRCMEGVLRRAKFPRFRQSVFRVQFPLSIRANP